MYDDHYGLTGRPFQLTPDPAFWYETATHRKAMAYLGYGLAQGEGFIVITGDIGAGKTTLIGHLKDTLDTRALNAITLVSTQIEAEDLLRIIATDLGVNPSRLAKAELLTAIERGLHAVARTGRRTLLIVDEAQALPVSALEELRMLSNFQAGGHALLQIVLLGQPEFRDRIQGSDRLEQLRQRVIAIHHLDPMAEDEVADYIAHRLSVVGWTGRPDFAEDAFAALYAGSGGVPRRLNLLAGRVMLYASIEGLELIDGATVETVLGDLHADLPMLHAPVAPDAAPMAIVPDAPQPVESPIKVVPTFVHAEPVEASSSAAVEETPVEPMAIVPDIAHPVPEASAVKVTVAEAAASADAPIAVEDEPRRSFVPRTSQWIDIDPAIDEPVVEPVPVLVARIAELESRVEQQEVALRRVLTLLVDWVEGDAAKPDHEPVKRTASWHDAA